MLAELKRVQPARLIRARVAAGKMHQLVHSNLKFAYETLTRKTAAEGSVLSIRSLPVTAECRLCRWRGRVRGGIFACGKCRSGDIEITGGRELFLECIEVERP